MTVTNVWVGRVAEDGARVRTKVTGASVQLLVSTNPDLTNPVVFGPVSPTAEGIATLTATGLDSSTQYHYAVEEDGTQNTTYPGKFRTLPAVGAVASFTVTASGDAGLTPDYPGVGDVLAPQRMSNHPVFNTIMQRNPLMNIHLGDMHYYDLGNTNIVGAGTVTNYRRALDDVLLQPRQHHLYRTIPTVWVWDDHDYGPNNSDGTLTTKDNAAQVYREKVPSYDLPDTGAIYHSWQVGRVLFIAWDVRYYRSPGSNPDGASKTMLGQAQKDWMRGILETSTARALVVISPVHWILTTSDDESWGSYATERQEIADMLADTGWTNRMVMLCADRHAAMLDSGANNDWGGFPTYGLSAMDATPHTDPYPFDVGVNAARDQYGIIAVTDDTTDITLTTTAYRGGSALFSHQLTVSTPIAPPRAQPVASGIAPAGAEIPLAVEYSYWPVNYRNGDLTVISNRPLPLSGVQFSTQARDVGQMRASIQLHDEEVRKVNPWDKLIPRQTGIVVVRTVTRNGIPNHRAVWHGILWEAPGDPETGRLNLVFETVESLWARRRITGPPPVGLRDVNGDLLPGVSWLQADQAQIVRDLLNPEVWSQFGVAGTADFPGWITVDAPQEDMGVPRDMTYRRGQQTPLLRAHQDRSKIINGYEWYTTVKLLTGDNAYAATSFRLEFIWGYPRLGRQYGVDIIPRFAYHTDGRGNVIDYVPVHDGTGVANIMWGSGAGYDEETVRAVSWNSADWTNGYLTTEDDYSNPDVSIQSTLQNQTDQELVTTYANEQFIDRLIVRGDLLPHFDTYAIGDDCLITVDDWTWPDNPDGTRGVTFISRIMGWTVTPPEGDQSEQADLLLAQREVV